MKPILIIPAYFLFLGIYQNEAVQACDLVPGNPGGSCMDLRSEPYITSQTSQFSNLIEGASVNVQGEIFAVTYGLPTDTNQLGRVYPSQGLFYQDSLRSTWINGIRFLNETTAYVADVINHRVIALHLSRSNGETKVDSSSNFCVDDTMLQPNDLTLAIKTGTVFTSGMQWLADTNDTHGDIWACLQDGRTIKLEVMGRTNGIDLSPDERTLYVSESYNRGGIPYIQKIWKYDVNAVEGTISGKTLFADFSAIDGTGHIDIDGMKTDVVGNLYVTRHAGSQVVIFSPSGSVIGKIVPNFSNPTNLEFGGPNGTTLFIVGKCLDSATKGCVDKIEVTNAGRSWKLLQG